MLEVRVAASPLAHSDEGRGRVGLIVPRHRQSAVARNRLKRQLRELSRTRILPTGIAVDIVIRTRAEAYGASFAELAAEVDRIVSQLHRWRPEFQRTGNTDSP